MIGDSAIEGIELAVEALGYEAIDLETTDRQPAELL